MFQCIPYIACYLHTYLLCSLIPRHFHHPVLNFLHLEVMRLLLRPLLDQYVASWRPVDMQTFTCMNVYPLCPLFVQHWYWLSNCSLTSQATPFADEAWRPIAHLEERKVVGRKTQKSSFALFAVILQVSKCHLCAWGPCLSVHQAMALIGNAKQAMSGGESGTVETGLTGQAATALF